MALIYDHVPVAPTPAANRPFLFGGTGGAPSVGGSLPNPTSGPQFNPFVGSQGASTPVYRGMPFMRPSPAGPNAPTRPGVPAVPPAMPQPQAQVSPEQQQWESQHQNWQQNHQNFDANHQNFEANHPNWEANHPGRINPFEMARPAPPPMPQPVAPGNVRPPIGPGPTGIQNPAGTATPTAPANNVQGGPAQMVPGGMSNSGLMPYIPNTVTRPDWVQSFEGLSSNAKIHSPDYQRHTAWVTANQQYGEPTFDQTSGKWTVSAGLPNPLTPRAF